MKILQSLIYGIISGISEFLPISSFGHQALIRKLFGASGWDPVMDLFVHLALLGTVVFVFWGTFASYQREYSISKRRSRNRRNFTTSKRTYELRLLFTAGIFMLLVLLLTALGRKTEENALLTCLFFLLNGVALFVPDYLRQSNKDASMLSGFDALLIGIASGLRVLPGFSGVGMGLSVAVSRGADKTQALNWMLILCAPALIMLCLFDLIGIFTVTGLSVTLLSFIGYILAAFGAVIGGYFTLMLVRFLIANSSFTGYACYCWGVAMLVFILNLIS